MIYTGIQFEFFSATEPFTAPFGSVRVDGPVMVLEVEAPGDRPYVIRGVLHDGIYRGEHEGLPEDVPVTAKWTQLDDGFVGLWVQQGLEYLFRFRLPASES